MTDRRESDLMQQITAQSMLILLRTYLLKNISEDCLIQLCFLNILGEMYCSCLTAIETDALICLI